MSAPSSELMPSHHHDGDDSLDSDDTALIASSVVQVQNQTWHAAPSLTRVNGLALVVSLQIGSGIFSAPTLISQHVSSPAGGLTVWVAAGLLVWTGAASFIELGLRIPRNGGIQEYLRACWGEFMGFLFTWVWVAVVKPAANAVIATIFADYLLKALWAAEPASPWTLKIVALGCITTLTLVNCLGATAGAKAANVFLLLKLSALGSIIIIGCAVYAFGDGDGVPKAESGWTGWDDAPPADPSTWAWLGNIATALFGALFCYGGWETVGFVVGDMVDPAGDLPMVMNGAMTLVIIGFFLMNAALYICLPFEVMRQSTTVVVEFAKRTLGVWAGLVFSFVVAISAMGALNANVFATSKLCVAASHRRYFPAILANLHCSTARDEAGYLDETIPPAFRFPVQVLARLTRSVRWERSVPILALLANGLLACFYVAIGSFNGLVTFVGLSEYVFFMMSVLGILVLRKGESHGPTGSSPSYRTWIGNPIIFATVSGLLILRGMIQEPLQGLAILFVGLLGLVVFYKRFGACGFEQTILT
ncbi:large neutral amino acids transporter small subunit 1 [Xylariaceae sp. FL0016]|nr:large neutral amino acids transporter small subunit 1 [Xylariaceae sp. FL0016]